MTTAVPNYFGSRLAAELYAAGRPYFHNAVIERVAPRLGPSVPVNDALDVGCGTGLSTRALTGIARRVVGMDVSPEMIAQAPRGVGVYYLVGRGEALPLTDASFDLVTVASAFHWMDRDRFLVEARRVLRPEGCLLVYTDSFRGFADDQPAFEAWKRDVHLARYPSPPRNAPFAIADAEPAGFRLIAADREDFTIHMTAARLVNYLMSHSNAVAIMDSGRETPEETRRFFTQEMAPFYAQADRPEQETVRAVSFTWHYWLMRKSR